jgi:hypothetical protein
MSKLSLAILVMCGCGSGNNAAVDGGPADSGPPLETRHLGRNDVSFLLATHMDLGHLDGINGGGDVVSREQFDRLVTSHNDLMYPFGSFVLFSIRFDLCDRIEPGQCPTGRDGSLRLVFQPQEPDSGTPLQVADAGLHAFYRMPEADMPAVVNELRAIARLSNMSPSDGLYPRRYDDGDVFKTGGRLSALVGHYAKPDQLIRLAVMGRVRAPDFHMVFRALELQNGQMVDLTIPAINATQQEIITDETITPRFQATPVADSPSGFSVALSTDAFSAAAPDAQRSALDAVVATQNPLLHTASTVQCIACHVSTYLGATRGKTAGIDLTTLPSQFAPNMQRPSVEPTARESIMMHGFSWSDYGWAGPSAQITQRVENESFQVVAEMEQRFPVP